MLCACVINKAQNYSLSVENVLRLVVIVGRECFVAFYLPFRAMSPRSFSVKPVSARRVSRVRCSR